MHVELPVVIKWRGQSETAGGGEVVLLVEHDRKFRQLRTRAGNFYFAVHRAHRESVQLNVASRDRECAVVPAAACGRLAANRKCAREFCRRAFRDERRQFRRAEIQFHRERLRRP